MHFRRSTPSNGNCRLVGRSLLSLVTFVEQQDTDMKNIALLFVFALLPLWGFGQLQLALLKYSGGGDWYSNPTALPNLAAFCNQYIKTDFTGD